MKAPNQSAKIRIGIIGYGRFGKLAAKLISSKSKVLVYDRHRIQRTSTKNIQHTSLAEAASCDVVILAVPVSSLERTLYSIRPHVRPAAIVIDVCAVKKKPVQWMRTILPPYVRLLGTHPLWGPDSVKDSLQGHRIVISPVRLPENILRHVIRLLKAAGLSVEQMSPDAHDKMIAESLFLTQYVGRVVGMSKLSPQENSTKSYTELMKIVRIADNDTRELFRDMVVFNPYAARVLKKLKDADEKIRAELK